MLGPDVRRHRCARTGLAIALVMVGVEPSAAAAPEQGPAFELEWLAPAGCPDLDDGAARIEAFLGRPPGQPGDPDVRAQVRIVGTTDGFTVEIELTIDGAPSQRTLHGRRCEIAAEGAAYVIAAVIDPTVDPPAPEPEPEPPTPTLPTAPRTPPAVRPAAERPSARPAAPRRTAAVRGALRIGGALGVGALPRVAGGLAASAGVLLPRLRFELGVSHWFARPARLDARPDTGGDIDLTAAAARVCPLVVARPVEVPLCAGLELGRMRGTGTGIAQPTTARLLWAALSASAGLVWMPSRWAGLWLDAALQVPISRPVFAVDGVGRVFQPAPAGFVGALGVEARFP